MPTKEVALRKRQQIAKANRTMFLWVAGVSVIVGFAAVGSIFLVQKLAFNQKVINEKNNTVSILMKNNKAVAELKDNIRLLDTNEGLNSVKAKSDDKALQVVLDALPADGNSLALGSSLQQKLIEGIPGLTLESLNMTPVAGVEVSSSANVQSATPVASSKEKNKNKIVFKLAVSGDANALKQLLDRFEHSIRAIDVTNLVLEQTNGKLTMTIDANAFYEPERVIELTDKVVKP
ncbi:MAG: hypothetical protein WAZ21_01655 [Candidatus Saccharimonadales bacterium]